jgi:hypothetical protein
MYCAFARRSPLSDKPTRDQDATQRGSPVGHVFGPSNDEEPLPGDSAQTDERRT